MADIQYLNYGDQQIEQQALLNNLANQVQGYVQKQPWSNKRKEKFMSAYSDLMNKGLIGASNKTGQWVIDVNGEIPLDSMDKKDKEMYQEAAYFIQQQMSQLPTKAAEEEKKKEDLPLFDNAYFTNSFGTLVNNRMAGGRDLEIGGENDQWNYLDERDSTGKRGRSKRAGKLAELLEEYSNSLEEGKYNFEGSPFKDLNEFKGRLNEAVSALRSEDINDDTPALNALGLDATKWFNNGTGDPSGFVDKETGKELTYGELAEYNANQAKLKAEQEKATLEAKNKTAYNNTIFINRVTNPKMSGRSAAELKQKYGDNNGLLSALQGYSQRDIRHLTPDEISEVHGAYKNLAKSPIDNNLLKQLQSSSSGLYRNAAPNRFRKINGIDNLIWDDAAKQVIQINTREQQAAFKNEPEDLFKGVKTQADIENEYFRNPNDGFTDADKRELVGIGLDLTAMFDPTRIYGTAAGLTASGLRTYNRATDADGFTLTDLGASALDIGLNGIQWLPGIGNVANGAKGIMSLAKFAPKIARIIGRVGATGGLLYGVSGIPEVWNKIDFAHPIDSAKKLTVEDWRKLGALVAGITGHQQLNQTNRAARKVLEMNDVKVSSRATDKIGLTRTKVESEVSTPTIRMKVGDKEVDIPIEGQVQKSLGKKLNKKGNDAEARSKIAREDSRIQEAAQKAGVKVKDKNGKLTEEWNKASVLYEPSWRNKSYFGKQIPGLAKNAGTFGTVHSAAANTGNNAKFQQYLEDRGLLSKAVYGSNRTLRRFDENFRKNGIYGGTAAVTESSNPEPKIKEKTTTNNEPKEKVTPEEIKQTRENYRKIMNLNSNEGREYIWSKNDVGVNPERLKQSVNIRGKELKFEISSSGELMLNGKTTGVNAFGKNGNYNVRKKVKEIVKSRMKSVDKAKTHPRDFKTMVEEIKKLKKSGFLKEGGKLTDQQIDNFLRQYK